MSDIESKRYQVPTHLQVNDQLTIWIFTFTFRQLGVLIGGGWVTNLVGTQFLLWPPAHVVVFLFGDFWTQIVRWSLVGLCAALTLALTFGRYQGRTLESWGVVWLGYLFQPRRYRWRQQPDPALVGAPPVLPVVTESEEA